MLMDPAKSQALQEDFLEEVDCQPESQERQVGGGAERVAPTKEVHVRSFQRWGDGTTVRALAAQRPKFESSALCKKPGMAVYVSDTSSVDLKKQEDGGLAGCQPTFSFTEKPSLKGMRRRGMEQVGI